MDQSKQFEGLGKLLAGTSSLVLTHGACLGLGFYSGTMNANGMDLSSNLGVDVPFDYLWASNVAGTSLGSLLLKEKDQSSLNVSSLGAAFGVVAAPLEYALGYSVGYAGSFIGNNVF